MTIAHAYGDILNAREDIIGHQVNCQGVMGSGLAKQIKDKYPAAYIKYKQVCYKFTPEKMLGCCQLVYDKESDKWIANLFGQLNYGREEQLYTDYSALTAYLWALKNEAISRGLSVALPYNLGCGLANGDWNIVHQIIDAVFYDSVVTLYKLN
ncbi:macro domain-containing protein [Paenibacillus alvei]|uniref:macro domain-containing protein n=1 Tax=Paenibacillus alvei TaxID=44250 RepID=UPI00227EDA54|nr:macro domain-containing protein [Paenibacillus alvei]MCY9737526.1 macro domain-containing protein [Paenibacillus alvei]